MQKYTELYDVNWTLLPTVLWGLCVYMACWHFTWPQWLRFEIGIVLEILIQYMYSIHIS